MSDFRWPCARREAHGPHRATWTQRAHEGTPATTTETGEYDCPGVPAHPNCMIGRAVSIDPYGLAGSA